MKKDIYREAVNDINIDEKILKELKIKMKEKPSGVRNMSIYKVLAAGAAVLIIAAAILIQNWTGLFSDNKIAKLNAGETVTLSRGKGTVYINKIEGIASSKIFIPEDAYSKDYKIEELAQVFGRDPLPSIPKEFKPASTSTNITFDAQGKMLFMSALSFSKDINNPDAPSIDIKMKKDSLPPKDCLYATDTLKESVIGSTNVVIGAMTMEDKFDDQGKPTEFYDAYSAEFIYNGVGYNITTNRTDGQTLLDLVNSIIK